MRYTKSWTEALQEVQEQVGVRKVDFVDGVTPDLQEAKPEFEVKYASSKKGPIKVSKFMSMDDAKKFLAQVKKDGMNGMISKGGKPVKEDHHEKDANGEPIPHDDEEDTSEAYTMHKGMKVKNVPRSAGKDAKKDNEARRAAQRKKLGLEWVGESMELQMRMAADDIETYAKKHGGIDKKDMMKAASMLKKGDKAGALKFIKKLDTDPRDYLLKTMGEELEEHCGECGAEGLQEADYELYHKDFSSAMQHAYAHAKKQGYTVDPQEIDNKVATGPRKPSKGKTNRYILGTDKKKSLHVQVANLDNKRFELNMYIEETEMDEASKEVKDRVKMFKKLRDKKSSQGFQPTGLKNEKKLDPVGQADADIDNDGDVDSSDKYLKNRRKKISKAIKNDESKLYSHVKSMMKKEYANIKKMKKS